MFDSLPITKWDFDALAAEPSLSECTVGAKLSAAFTRRAVTVKCNGDETLFLVGEPGNNIYLILSGEVGLLLPVTGTAGLGFRALPGSLVGLPAAFSNQPYSMAAIAWKGSEVAVMSRDRFCDLIASNGTFSFEVLKILAAETRAARMAIVDARAKHRNSK